MERHDAADRDAAHVDVAAYALGVLEPAEAERYERHLAGCASCTLELEQLLPTTALLATVDPASLRQPDETSILDRLLAAVAAERRRLRRRFRITLASGTAVAALATVLALVVGAPLLTASPGTSPVPTPPVQAATPPAGIGGEAAEGERFTATDPTTGVTVEAHLSSWDWGTAVAFTLSTLTGPRDCELVLVYADGSEKIAGSWRVPREGYGTPERPSPLRLQAPVGGERSDLIELRVVEVLLDGSRRPLVSLPL